MIYQTSKSLNVYVYDIKKSYHFNICDHFIRSNVNSSPSAEILINIYNSKNEYKAMLSYKHNHRPST